MRVCSYCHQLVPEGDTTCIRDGAPVTDGALARVPGQVLARFPAVEPFARGKTGSLYLAVQAQSGYRGLLKVLAPEIAVSPAERTRLKRELRKQTALTNNALSRIIDGGEVGADLWLFRDFVQGDSLAIQLRKRGALPLPEALAISAQIASGLDELHRQGLLHRDLKPSHVLLTARVDAPPAVTLVDAGIAPKLPSSSVFEILGTPEYVAPEIIAGKPASFRSDLYALGAVLYEMLAGLPPFVADNVEELLSAQRDIEPRELGVELPPPVRALLSSLLAKDPRKRPFSAQQVRRALEPYLPPGTPEPSSGSRTLAGNLSAPVAEPSRPAVEPASRPAPARTSTASTPQVPPLARPVVGGAAAQGPARVSPKPALTRPSMTEEIDISEVEEAWPVSYTEEIDVSELEAASGPSWPRAQAVPDAPTVVQPLEAQAVQLMASAAAEPMPVFAPEPPPPPAEAAPAPEPVAPASAPARAEEEDERAEDVDDSGLTMVKPMAAIAPPSAATAPASAQAAPALASPPAAEATAEEKRASRKSVDFDVESLFDDSLEENKKPIIRPAEQPPAPVPEAVYEPPRAEPAHAASADDEDREDPYAPKPSVPSIAPPSYEADEHPPTARYVTAAALPGPGPSDRPVPDPEGTVVVPRRAVASAQRPPLAWLVGGAVAALVVVILVARSCGDDGEAEVAANTEAASSAEPAGPASERGAGSTGSSATAPAEQPAHAEPTPSERAAAKAPAAAEPPPAQKAPADAPTIPTTSAPVDAPAADTSERRSDRRPRSSAPVPYRAPSEPEAGVDYREKARELYQAGKYREAALAYEKVTQQSPSDAGAFAGLGASWLAANQPDRAILAYSRAVQLKPKVSGFHAALGRAYLQKNDRGRAASAYRKALELDPNNQAAKTALQSLGR